MEEYAYKLGMQVRDYECDMQGIVNNAVYQNYLEHTRHEFLKTIGIDFAEYTRRKIILVVVRIEIDYKFPLKSGDEFWVGLNCAKESRIKFSFLQNIFRSSDNKPIIRAKIIATALNEKGRPSLPAELEETLAAFTAPQQAAT